MANRQLRTERRRFEAYVAERPSAEEGSAWLLKLGFKRIVAKDYPLEVSAGSGQALLQDPLLRGGFLDDVYECFEDSHLADDVMTAVAEDVQSFAPLVAQRCVLSGWKPGGRTAR
jgi:hypothetical protein